MIVELGLVAAGAVSAWLAFDNWRLRKRLRRLIGPVEPVNVLSNGVVLPEPDDPRWTKKQARRFLLGYQNAAGHPVRLPGPEESMLVLGEVAIAFHDRRVFIDNNDAASQDDPKAKRYAEAVIIAHSSRRAMVSIEDDPDAGQV